MQNGLIEGVARAQISFAKRTQRRNPCSFFTAHLGAWNSATALLCWKLGGLEILGLRKGLAAKLLRDQCRPVCAGRADCAEEYLRRNQPAMSYHPFWLVTAVVYVVLLWLYFKVLRRYLK
jgi:hypothetical protein